MLVQLNSEQTPRDFNDPKYKIQPPAKDCENTCCQCDECNVNKQFIRFFEEMIAFEKKECECKEVVREITRYLVKDPEDPKVVKPNPTPPPPNKDPPVTPVTPPVTGDKPTPKPDQPIDPVSCNGIKISDATGKEILAVAKNGNLTPADRAQKIADLVNGERDKGCCSCCKKCGCGKDSKDKK